MQHKTPKLNKRLIIFLIPMTILVISGAVITWVKENRPDIIQKTSNAFMDFQDRFGKAKIPEEYIPIYMAAEKEYGVPWTLLAAHHRIETRFSTMDPLLSPAGAEGHMQFMPCTFVGWNYPGCEALGKGDIPNEDKTNPEVIKKYGGYGVDANGDGIADPYDIEDAIFSTANYLSIVGAADGEIEKAVFDYNKSDQYVENVLWYYEKFEEVRPKYDRRFKQIVSNLDNEK